MTGYYPEAICHQCGLPTNPGTLHEQPTLDGTHVEIRGYCPTHGTTRVEWSTT